MKSGRTSRWSIRSALFVGTLAGSIFSSSGAFAEVISLDQSNFYTEITDHPDRNYELISNIDISIANAGEIPVGSTVFATFSGTLDGRGNVISGISKPLFSHLDGTGGVVRIENLILQAVDTVSGVEGAGMLAVTAEESTIRNIDFTGNVTAESVNIGGLIGTATNVVLEDVNGLGGTVTNVSYGYPNGSTGGLIGESTGILIGRNQILNSSSYMDVITNSSSVGGLVGNLASTNGLIQDSFAEGNIIGSYNVGGLAGTTYGTVLNSHTESDVFAAYSVAGGLVGFQSGGKIMDSSASGRVESGSDVGGLVGANQFHEINPIIYNSSATGTVIGVSNVGGLLGAGVGDLANNNFEGSMAGGSSVGGLVGIFNGNIENSFANSTIEATTEKIGGLVGQLIEIGTPASIHNSFSQGTITSGGSSIGGLVGYSFYGSILNSFSDMDLTGQSNVGGLIGQADIGTEVNHSFSSGSITAPTRVGGIAGSSELSIFEFISSDVQLNNASEYAGGIIGIASNNTRISDATYSGTIITGVAAGSIGGVAGKTDTGTELTNVHTAVTISTSGSYVGGLVGYAYGSLDILNSTSTYAIDAHTYAGGLIGYSYSGTPNSINIYNSFGRGELSICEGCIYKGSIVGFADATGASVSFGDNIVGSIDQESVWNETQLIASQTSVLQNFSAQRQTGNTWAICASANGSNPYLISMYLTDPCQVSSSPRAKKSLREMVEVISPEKIERTIGFKNETSFPKNASIAFVDENTKIDITKVKAVEIAPTANVKVTAKAGEALQISLKSDSKEPVELWVKSPDGTWLLAGVITFDKDGKAILPPLQFKSAGDYTLVLNKPSADSAKGSAPLNQSGSVLVAVS